MFDVSFNGNIHRLAGTQLRRVSRRKFCLDHEHQIGPGLAAENHRRRVFGLRGDVIYRGAERLRRAVAFDGNGRLSNAGQTPEERSW